MTVVYLKSFLNDIKKIKDPKVKRRILEIIQNLKAAQNFNSLKGVKKLHGHFFAYRIRIGDYRLGFFKENDTIILVRFLKRSDIYKLFPKGY